MRLPFRRKDKKKSNEIEEFGAPVTYFEGPLYDYPPTYRSAQLVAHLPPNVLQRIFAFVCPHACDESYENCEESASDGGCMLCDLRDLGHCVLVNRQWRKNAVPVMYVSFCPSPSLPSKSPSPSPLPRQRHATAESAKY